MTVMGQQAKDIYKNQKALRDQLAEAAGAALWVEGPKGVKFMAWCVDTESI
jgi:hypothetical protein